MPQISGGQNIRWTRQADAERVYHHLVYQRTIGAAGEDNRFVRRTRRPHAPKGFMHGPDFPERIRFDNLLLLIHQRAARQGHRRVLQINSIAQLSDFHLDILVRTGRHTGIIWNIQRHGSQPAQIPDPLATTKKGTHLGNVSTAESAQHEAGHGRAKRIRHQFRRETCRIVRHAKRPVLKRAARPPPPARTKRRHVAIAACRHARVHNNLINQQTSGRVASNEDRLA